MVKSQVFGMWYFVLGRKYVCFFGPILNVQISIKEGLAKWSPQTCLWKDIDTLTPLIEQISGINSKGYKSRYRTFKCFHERCTQCILLSGWRVS